MQEVILVPNPNCFPCEHCGDTRDETMECPVCKKKFCGNCFQENLEGDGSTIFCPNPDCNTELKLPMSSL